ncbi:MAG: acyl-CoA thioesterase [Deltaproteobacteria bacterium]|nr:acyl-CoA thioesterase [Deltaproteobacteria bacterium]
MSPEVTTEIPVRYRDCDPLGHVNNAVYLTYFEIGRVEFWRSVMGADIAKAEDWPFILAEATVTYRAPARFAEVLRLTIGVESIGTKSWVFRYRITGAGDREIAVGRTVQVAYDYHAAKTTTLPDAIRAKLEGRT